jgi:hypothetical protein
MANRAQQPYKQAAKGCKRGAKGVQQGCLKLQNRAKMSTLGLWFGF